MKLVITLDETDLIELAAILTDDDEKAALEFVRTRISPKIPVKGTGHCDSSRINPYLSSTNR